MQFIDDQRIRILLERCARGDESGLVEIHNILASRIYGFAMHRLRSDDDARSVVIDTLHEVWRCAAKYRGDSAVLTWIFGIARHKIVDLARTRHVNLEDIEEYSDQLVDECSCVESGYQYKEESRIMRQCIDKLKTIHRECLQLVYFEGMSLIDVSIIQKSPESTIKTRLFHARNRLRDCVEQNGLS